MNATSNNGDLVIAGDVSLLGHGTVTLSDFAGITGNGSPATLSTDNVISGAGGISGYRPTLVNEVGGVIDATGDRLGLGARDIENSGTLEATNPQGLSTTGGLFISGIARNAPVTINNTLLGVIEANGANTHVNLSGVGPLTIVGGTLETRGANAVITVAFDGHSARRDTTR